jgi:putative ABC transport system substrate-binding protein
VQDVTDAFADQLHQHGWTAGENLMIEWRFADGNAELIPQLAADLVSLPVDVLVTSGAAAALPAHQQTSMVPIVLVNVGDPTIADLVKNLAHPAGNVTGTTFGGGPVAIKTVELLRTVLPQLSRVAIFGADPTAYAASYASTTLPTVNAAQTQGLQVQVLAVSRVDEVDGAMEAAQAWGAEGLVMAGGAAYLGAVDRRISDLAAERHLPTMFTHLEGVTESGGLMAFGQDRPAEWRKAADYVDKILRGASPADLPVQEPDQYDFLVNVKVAQDLGISFPPDATAQVTQWIQ